MSAGGAEEGGEDDMARGRDESSARTHGPAGEPTWGYRRARVCGVDGSAGGCGDGATARLLLSTTGARPTPDGRDPTASGAERGGREPGARGARRRRAVGRGGPWPRDATRARSARRGVWPGGGAKRAARGGGRDPGEENSPEKNPARECAAQQRRERRLGRSDGKSARREGVIWMRYRMEPVSK